MNSFGGSFVFKGLGVTALAIATETLIAIHRAAALAPARSTTFLGREFLVVPAVLVRSQVLNNNMGRTFLPEDEITADWANEWNNIPVLVGDHPRQQGVNVSARNPDLINQRGVGWIFGARIDTDVEGVRRLSAEVWLDVERASVVPGFADVLAAVDAGHPVELSTGFAVLPEETGGINNNEQYDWILHPQGADHLVISTEMTGACSVQDGCGLGVNSEGGCACGGKCTAAIREVPVAEQQVEEELVAHAPTQSVDGEPHPASHFAYVPDPQQPSTWKLPIFDANHVRNALARLNQTQIPAAAMAGVKRKIRAAARRFGVDAASLDNSKSLWERATQFLGFARDSAEPMSYEDMVAANIARLAAQQLTPSDEERRQMLKEALQAKYGDNSREVIVCDVYSDTEKYVVFWFQTPMGPQPKGQEYLKAEWADNDNDGIPEITQQGNPVLVRRQISYEPVGPGPAGDSSGAAGGAAGGDMTGQAAAANAVKEAGEGEGAVQGDPPASAAANTHQEDGTMAGENQEVLAAINKVAERVEALATKVTALEASDESIAGLKRSISALTEKVGNMERLTAPAVAEREKERAYLVTELAGNHRVPFTVVELESKPLSELRKIAEMAQIENYAGKGGPQAGNTGEERRFAEPVPFTAPKAEDKK